MTEAAAYWRAWEERLGPDGLISYRYLGCRSVARSRHHAEGRMRVRRDLRIRSGFSAAALGIALLDTAGINVDALAAVAPTRIDLDVLDPADDVEEVRIVGSVVREGRTQMFTEGRIEDAARPGRLLAYGTTSWAVVGPVPPGYRYQDPGPGIAEQDATVPLAEVFGATREGPARYVIPGLTARLGGASLHQGPIQIVLEAAATDAVGTTVAEGRPLRLERMGTAIVAAGRKGPFSTSAEVLSTTGATLGARAELSDEGTGRTVATAFCRWRVD